MARLNRPDIAPRTAPGGGKLVFANQLRGLASLCVVLSHLGGVFILMGPVVGWITSAPEMHAGRPAILWLTSWSWLNFGALGVAIFFLISGFVIPFSMRTLPPGPFLVARFLRIFPTLWAALLVEWLAVHAQSLFYGRTMAFGPLVYVENAFLLATAIGSGFVDLVNWTLAVEVKFYILMAVLRPFVLRGRVLPFFLVSLAAIAIAAGQTHGWLPISPTLAIEPMFIGFMLVGTLFHYHLTGLMTGTRAAGAGAVLLGLFLFCWKIGPNGPQFPQIPANYLYGLAAFGLAYAARRWFRPMRWLDLLADISYPLYLVHSIIGYSVMTFAMARFHLSYGGALPFALLVVLVLAWVLHRLVERPTLELGRRLAARLKAVNRGVRTGA